MSNPNKDALPPTHQADEDVWPQPDSGETDAQESLSPSPSQTTDQPADRSTLAIPPVVGIGASAGGLAALETFFDNTPADTGMAFVVVVHLMRDRVSNLAGLLQSRTRIQVVQIEDGMPVAANHVYVIPPDRELGILDGRLQLLKLSDHAPPITIDSFFRHLADDQGSRAICVILSGSGSDGTLGLKAVAEQGGLVVVQTPESAEYSPMPRSAIDTGLADLVLDPAAMPQALVRYRQQTNFTTGPTDFDETQLRELNKVIMLVRAETGLNFGGYRPTALYRRVSKRMAVYGAATIPQYIDILRHSHQELVDLYREVLISVTQFFREPDAFEALRAKVLPALFKERPADQPLRIWVAGCSTGEEAYSLAMLLHEYLHDRLPHFKVEIFATDINAAVIDKARIGFYPPAISADVPAHYLERYFTKEEDGYRIAPEIREMVVFAEQNLLDDPPFSKLDLLSCRNLLIYLRSETQGQVLSLFHYALKPGGFLFLGSSESVGDLNDYFTAVDRQWRLFKRTNSRAAPPPLDLPFFDLTELHRASEGVAPAGKGGKPFQNRSRFLLEKSLLEHYEPVGIMVDADFNILYTYGQVDLYLKVVPGEFRFNVVEMLRPELDVEVPPALRYALINQESTDQRHIWVKHNGGGSYVNITVKPVGDSSRQLALIIIERMNLAEPAADVTESSLEAEDEGLQTVKAELIRTENRLQKTIEELQAANEEHRSYAEELQSGNEELQSTNEELTTSQEELRSVNEELVTANSEIQKKNVKLRHANNDLHNLLAATDIATIFLDTALRIKRFTPAATKIVNLIESDKGRPFKHIVQNFKDDRVHQDLEHVLSTLNTVEREVQTETEQWFAMRIMPYRTVENIIEGAVLTFVEITRQKTIEAELRQARDYARNIIDTLHESVLVLDNSLHIISANRSFYRRFGVTPEQTKGRLIYDLGNRQWNIPELRELLEEIIPRNRTIEQYDIEHDFPAIGRRTMRLNARRLNRPDGEADQILLAIQDMTGPERTSR